MKITLLAVGSKMPQWVQQGVDEYAKRIEHELGFSIIEIPLAKRSKTQSVEQMMQKEGAALLGKVPKGDHLVALEVGGKKLSTSDLATRLQVLNDDGRNLSLLIGGPDGLASTCRQQAVESWSLSSLTLPHPLVRVLLTEQLYRAWSVVKGHPYHRE
ncbi:MAG: 23S rRNA (pseudouridine(1915)-N(3))-methyltransferase RlmH [Gammaproteobacteria bacterium]